jgi:hypothetical protein
MVRFIMTNVIEVLIDSAPDARPDLASDHRHQRERLISDCDWSQPL